MAKKVDRREFLKYVGAFAGGAAISGILANQHFTSLPTKERLVTVTKTETASLLDELVRKAKQEGKLTIYTGNPPQLMGAALDLFKEKYGIVGEQFRLVSFTLVEKLRSEQSAGVYNADVIQGGGTALEVAIDEGLTSPYRPMETETGAIREGFYDPGGRWVAHQLSDIPMLVMKGPNRIPENLWPKAWRDFIKPRPEWKGKMTSPSPTASSAAYNQLWCWDHFLGREVAKGIVQGYTAAGGKWHTVWATQYDDLVTGGADIDLCGLSHEWKINLIDKKITDAVQVFPEDGTVLMQSRTTLAKSAPHPNAAKLFIEFLTSQECVSLLSRTFMTWPVRKDVPPPPGKWDMNKVKTLVTDEVQAAKDRDNLIGLFDKWVSEARTGK